MKQSKPRVDEAEKPPVVFASRIEPKVTMKASDKDKVMFKSFTFFFDIQYEGKPHDEYFKNKALEYGGKVSGRLAKNVTHVVWSQGKNKTLIKATELEWRIVTPLWLEEGF